MTRLGSLDALWGMTEAETARLGRADLPAAALELDVEDLQRRLDAAIRERDAHAAEVGRMRDQRGQLVVVLQSLRGLLDRFALTLWSSG